VSKFYKKMKNKILRIIRRVSGTELIQTTLDKNLAISNEIKWGNIFRDTIQESDWLKQKSFSSGRWAAGYPFLYILYRTLDMIEPKSILEFGLGETSKITTQYYKAREDESCLRIIEHDKNWIAFFSKKLACKNVILQLDIETIEVKGFKTNTYSKIIEKLGNNQCDLIIIDAPIGSSHFSRYQIITVVENNLLAKDFIIIFDDTDRKGEAETLSELKSTLQKNGYAFDSNTYSGEKQTTILCSPKYSFLLSL
jgi:hypothetical protein